MLLGQDKDEWSLASAFTAENDEDEPDDETVSD